MIRSRGEWFGFAVLCVAAFLVALLIDRCRKGC